jgi:hypothetical protein
MDLGCVVPNVRNLHYNIITTIHVEAHKERSFTLNQYSLSVALCIIHGKQGSVGWYVDDSKISHDVSL